MSKVILNNIIQVISGGTPKTSIKEYWNGAIGWLSINDFNNDLRKVYISEKTITEKGVKESNTKILEIDDLIISARGTVGVLAQIGKPMAFNQSCFGLRGKSKVVDNTYLYYALKNYVSNIQKKGQGSVFNTINLDSFKLMEIDIEDKIEDQKKIANILASLDDKIELNNKINDNLEQMAKTLYDYWFVQFDFPDKKGKPYKSSGGKMVYNEILKREMPESWELKSLFDVSDVQYGYPFSTDFFNTNGNGYPVIRIRDILENSISNYSTEKDIDRKYRLEKGDLLIGMDGNFHINYWSKENCYLNQRVVKIRKKELSNIFIRHQIEPFIKLREKSVSRTTVGHLSDKDLKAIRIITPEKAVRELANTLFDNFLKQILFNQQQNLELSSLRDWLLPMLMNGQVEIV